MNPETITTIPRVDDALPFDGARWNRYFSNWMGGFQAQAATWNDQDGGQLIAMDPTGKTVGIAGVIDADSGGVTISAPVEITATVDVTGAVTIVGDTAITGAFGVTGDFTLTGAMAVSSTATFSGPLVAESDVTLGNAAGDDILINGTATFAEDVTMAKGLIVDTTTLVVEETNNKVGVGVVPASTDAMLQVAGAIRASALTGIATSGSGMEMQYDPSGNIGYLTSVSRPSTFRAMEIYGSSIKLMGGALNKLEANATGIGVFATTPVAQQSIGAAATDPATTMALVNEIRTRLRAYGWLS